jgi:limonene-1,2-epoxide hydrolase
MTDAEMEILNLAGAGNVVLTERVDSRSESLTS